MITFTPTGYIQLRLDDLFAGLPDEDKLAFLEDLSCQDVIIRHVADQITEGYTENRCRGGAFFPARSDGDKEAPLDRARRQIVKELDLVTGGVVDRLERSLQFHEEQAEERRKEAERAIFGAAWRYFRQEGTLDFWRFCYNGAQVRSFGGEWRGVVATAVEDLESDPRFYETDSRGILLNTKFRYFKFSEGYDDSYLWRCPAGDFGVPGDLNSESRNVELLRPRYERHDRVGMHRAEECDKFGNPLTAS